MQGQEQERRGGRPQQLPHAGSHTVPSADVRLEPSAHMPQQAVEHHEGQNRQFERQEQANSAEPRAELEPGRGTAVGTLVHHQTASTVVSLPRGPQTSMNTTQMLQNSFVARARNESGGAIPVGAQPSPRQAHGRATERPQHRNLQEADPDPKLPRQGASGTAASSSQADEEEDEEEEDQPALEAKDMYALSGLPLPASRLAALFDEGATAAGGSLSARIRDGAPLELAAFAVPRHLEEAKAALRRRRQSVR